MLVFHHEESDQLLPCLQKFPILAMNEALTDSAVCRSFATTARSLCALADEQNAAKETRNHFRTCLRAHCEVHTRTRRLLLFLRQAIWLHFALTSPSLLSRFLTTSWDSFRGFAFSSEVLRFGYTCALPSCTHGPRKGVRGCQGPRWISKFVNLLLTFW